jgi:PAS domain S-box-containing protein
MLTNGVNQIIEASTDSGSIVESVRLYEPDVIVIDGESPNQKNVRTAIQTVQTETTAPLIMIRDGEQGNEGGMPDKAPFGYIEKPLRKRSVVATINAALNANAKEDGGYLEKSDVAPGKLVDGGTILMHEGLIRFVNGNAQLILGYSKNEMDLTDLFSHIHPDDRRSVMKLYDRLISGKEDSGAVVPSRIIDKQGRVKSIELEMEHIQWERRSMLLVHVKELDEKARAEEAVQEPEDMYRLLVECASEGIAVVQEGIIRYANPALIKMLGYAQQEIIGKQFAVLLLEEDRLQETGRTREGLDEDSGPEAFDLRVVHKDGNVVWVEMNSAPIMWGGKQATLNFIRNIAGQKPAESTRIDGQEQMKYFLDNLSDIAYMSDGHGYITYINKTAEAISGVKLKDILNKPPKLTLFAEESREIVLDAFQAVMHGQNVDCELNFSNGRTFDFKNQPLRGRRGEIIGAFGIAREITKARNEEEKLKLEAERQSAILNSMYERIQYLDNTMRIVWANNSVCHSMGLDLDEIEGNQCFQLFHRRTEPCEGCPAVKAIKTGHIQKGEIPYPDGKTWLLRSYPIRDERFNVIGVTIKSVDIGEQAQDREKLSQLMSIGRSATKDGIHFSAPLDPEYLYPFSLFIDYQNDEFVISLGWREFEKEFPVHRLTRSETATARFIYMAARMKHSPPGWVDKEIIRPGKRDININALRRLLEDSDIPWCDKISARMLIRSSRDENKRIRLALLPENIEITESIKNYRSKKHKYAVSITEKITELEESLANSKGDVQYLKEELKIQRINRINVLKSIEIVEYLIHESIKILNSSEPNTKLENPH